MGRLLWVKQKAIRMMLMFSLCDLLFWFHMHIQGKRKDQKFHLHYLLVYRFINKITGCKNLIDRKENNYRDASFL